MWLCSDKLSTPKIIQKYVVNRYKTYLLHPIIDCTETNIGLHFYDTNLRDYMNTHIKVYRYCQKSKKQSLKYGLLLAKEAEPFPLTEYQYILQAHTQL